VICGEDGIPVFDRLRYGRQSKTEAVLFAFDLVELDGKDLHRAPLEARKGELAKLLRKAPVRLQLNEHIEEAGDIVFRHACRLGFEGMVSKRLGSPYISGRSRVWLKFKNPAAPAVKREAVAGMSAYGKAARCLARFLRFGRRFGRLAGLSCARKSREAAQSRIRARRLRMRWEVSGICLAMGSRQDRIAGTSISATDMSPIFGKTCASNDCAHCLRELSPRQPSSCAAM
jgi:hypothetical protein